MGKIKKIILPCGIFAILIFSGVLFWNHMQKNATVQEISIEETNNISLTKEEAIYNDLIGNLSNFINTQEKEKINFLISDLLLLNEEDEEKRSDIFKKIVEVLDEVTLRVFDEEELSKYKEYYLKQYKVAEPILSDKYRINEKGDLEGDFIPEKAKECWEKAKKIIPFELLKGVDYFNPFKVDSKDKQMRVVGYMQPEDGFLGASGKWVLGVFEDADIDELAYMLIHEYGHFISLKDSNSYSLLASAKLKKDSVGELMKPFFEIFKYVIEEREAVGDENIHLFYARHKSDFVTKYAAVNIMEDFAESFARFIIDSPADQGKIRVKRKYFEDSQYFKDIKNKILSNCKSNGINKINEKTE